MVRHMKYTSMSDKKAKMRMADFLAVGEACRLNSELLQAIKRENVTVLTS